MWLGVAQAEERQMLDVFVGVDRGGTPDFVFGRVHGVAPVFGAGWRAQWFGESDTRVWKGEAELSMAFSALGAVWFEGEKVELVDERAYSSIKLDFAYRFSLGSIRAGKALVKPHLGIAMALPARLYEVEAPGLAWNFAVYSDVYGLQLGAVAEVGGWQVTGRGDLMVGPLLASAAPPGSFGRVNGGEVEGGTDNLSGGGARLTRYTARLEKTYGGLAPWVAGAWESNRLGVGERPGISGPLRGRGLTLTVGLVLRQKVEERDRNGGEGRGRGEGGPGGGGGVEAARKAAASGNVAKLQAMLDAGYAPDTALPLDGTALAAAAGAGQIEAMTLLLDRGASVEASAPANGGTALMAAATGDQAAAIELLLARGALVDRRDTNGEMTALMHACWSGSPAAVDRLLRAGADRTLTSTKTASGGGFDCAAWNERGFGTAAAKAQIAARLAQP
jgi:hypothetical protein